MIFDIFSGTCVRQLTCAKQVVNQSAIQRKQIVGNVILGKKLNPVKVS